MIDELVLEELLAEIAAEIDVPDDGAERVVHALSLSARPTRRPSPRITRVLAVAAAVLVLAAIGAVVSNATRSSSTRISAALRPSTVGTPTTVAVRGRAPRTPAVNGPQGPVGPQGATGGAGVPGPVGNGIIGNVGSTGSQGLVGRDGPQGLVGSPGLQGEQGTQGPAGPTGLMGGAGAVGSPAGGIQDGAKIVKAGTLDLDVPHGRLRTAVNRVSGVATGFGGYMATTQTKYGGNDATAQITMRIPVANFEAAITKLTHLPEVTVLSQSSTGADVTGQYVNVEAQMIALTAKRDSFLALLNDARNIGDILTLHDRVAGVQSQIDEHQGRLNLLDHQSALSSLAITLSEKPAPEVAAAAAKVTPPPTGLSKAWIDARRGFSDAIEWILARSGGALIVFIALLALLFGLRYLYPVVRRGLL